MEATWHSRGTEYGPEKCSSPRTKSMEHESTRFHLPPFHPLLPLSFYSLFIRYTFSLDFSFSFLPLYFTREESKKKKKSDNRDAYRVALFPFSHRERLTASSRWTTRNCASVHQGELCRALHVVLDRDGIDFRKASHCFSPRILSDFSLSSSLVDACTSRYPLNVSREGDYIVPLWNCNIAKCDETWRFSDSFFSSFSSFVLLGRWRENILYFSERIPQNERIERVSLKIFLIDRFRRFFYCEIEKGWKLLYALRKKIKREREREKFEEFLILIIAKCQRDHNSFAHSGREASRRFRGRKVFVEWRRQWRRKWI